jgi:hypothetical protein
VRAHALRGVRIGEGGARLVPAGRRHWGADLARARKGLAGWRAGRGQPLRHGVAQRKMALLRVGKALFERIDEDGWSQLDMEIHEHPIVEGEVGEIGARIEHRDDRGLAHFVTKHRDYAQWEAKRFAKMQGDEAVWAAMTDRQRFKYSYLPKWWFPWFYFAATYFVKLGFLDGGAGFHYAAYKAWYFQTIRLLIREQSAAGNAHG